MSLDEVSSSISNAAERVAPAVVRIGRDGGRGAGMVLGPGLVLTSAHNLRGESVTVTFADGRSATGQVRGADGEGDLAVVGVETGDTPALAWPPLDTGRPALGDPVLAVSLLPAGGARVTAGHVSAVEAAFRGPRGRLITDGFEHTAVVGRGSSGGPVVDREGRLLGINTHRPGEGLYLAIPASEARRQSVEALARGQSPIRRRLGVALTPPHIARRLRAAVGLEARDGLLVREVGEATPAAAAGVQTGDLIVAVDGEAIGSLDDLLAAVEAAGQTVRLGVVRGTEDITVEVRFES